MVLFSHQTLFHSCKLYVEIEFGKKEVRGEHLSDAVVLPLEWEGARLVEPFDIVKIEQPGELLWQAQLERWRVRPPLGRGQGIVLLGGSGAGKSTLAHHLARCLGLADVDADQRVEAASGRSIAAIFAEQGEAGFRALEAQAVRSCLAAPAVVALGAGAWQDPGTREAVRASGFAALWVAEVPERAWSRVGGDPLRPLATTRAQFMARWAQRTPAWSEAPMVLPLGRAPQALAEALVRPLAAR